MTVHVDGAISMRLREPGRSASSAALESGAVAPNPEADEIAPESDTMDI